LTPSIKAQLLKVKKKAIKQMAEYKPPQTSLEQQQQDQPSQQEPQPQQQEPSTTSSTSDLSQKTTSDSAENSIILSKLHILNKTFLKELSNFASKYHEYFLERSVMASLLTPAVGTLNAAAAAAAVAGKGLGSGVGGKLSGEERDVAVKAMREVVDELVKDYFGTVTDLLAIPVSHSCRKTEIVITMGW
jgi:hypothetical protein